jgi:hypothetical protein
MTPYNYIDIDISDFDKGVALAEEFEKVLECDSEETIHQYLLKNTVFLNCLCDDGSILFSKFKLADSYIPDFAILGQERSTNSKSAFVTLIEIERSDKPLFTKSGDPTSFLSHSVRQVQNWKTWIDENKAFLKNKYKDILIQYPIKQLVPSKKWQRNIEPFFGMDYGFYATYICIVGRRSSLTIKDNILLGQMNHDLSEIKIITYDVLLENYIKLLKLLKYNHWDY